MRKAVAAACTALLSVGAAHAADLGGSMKEMPVPMGCVACWGGLYVGTDVGFGVGDTAEEYYGYATALPSANFDVNGELFAIHVDYNFTNGPWVFGVEGSFNATNIDGHFRDPLIPVDELRRQLEWYTALTGRIGYAPGNIMYYTFVGPAWGNVKTTENITATGWSDSSTHFGWTAGVGLEWALNDRFTAKIEYAHINLDSETIFGPRALDPRGATGHHKADLEFDAVKIGVSYKLRGREDRVVEMPMK